ncbi:MAG: DNA polymerase IV [Bacteroidota bacterium]|nr:DNA polymerase IV [Bacteroidota bacterium]
MRTIFHLDLDAFFVSVERILDPRLNGKPVIVGADPGGRGVVSACSYEARRYGLHSAMPIRMAYKLCPNGIYLKGHYDEYIRYSNGVKDMLTKYAPLIKQASIDEFSMDFTGCEKIYGHLMSFASFIQKEIKEKLSLPCSIGIGSNKMIAKIASDCLKPRGITFVIHGLEKEFLAPMPVEVIPGVGKVMHSELNNRGFYLIKDILNYPEEYFYHTFGKSGQDLWDKANGRGSDVIHMGDYQQKSISKEHTYGKDELSRDTMKSTLFYLTSKVGQHLRDDNLQASTISIKLRYSDFKTLTRAKTVKPTDDDKIIFNTAWQLLDKAFTRRVTFRLIGISLSNLSDYAEQESLFEDEEAKRAKMLKAITKIRDQFGFHIIQVGTLQKND